MGIQLLPTANALEAFEGVMEEMQRLERNFPPGLEWQLAFDNVGVVRESIVEVLKTLGEAIRLVILVMFLFLQNWRSTIIPAMTIPVSLIGTFAFLKLFDFSINTLTLFGIVLATGIVVDDAIVVIENIERHMREYGKSAREAAVDAMREVFGAVVVIGIVLVAVFVPVAFFPGTTGRLYQQFSLTIAFATMLSVFNAVTLTPALSAILLDRHGHEPGRFFGGVNRVIDASIRGYARVLEPCAAVEAGHARALRCWPDRHLAGLPDGAVGVRAAGGRRLLHDDRPGPVGRVAGVHDRHRPAGREDPVRREGDTGGVLGARLQLHRRGAEQRHDVRASARLERAAGQGAVARSRAESHPRTAVRHSRRRGRGRSRRPAFRACRCSAGSSSSCSTSRAATSTASRRRRRPSSARAIRAAACEVSSRSSAPTIRSWSSNIDRDRARSLGLPLREVTDALQVFLGSQYVNDFDFNNRAYRVYVQADQRFRADPGDLGQLYARAQSGDMVPLDTVVQLKETTAPQVITHFNMFRSAEINGIGAPGVSSGQALEAMEQLARQTLPPGFDFAWAGQSLEEIKAGSQAGYIFALSMLIVYLVLAAQYESWVLPFIILLGVPLAVFGALSAQLLRGFANDVFCQVGLVMLVGLAAKNSILIVEFAEQLRERGMSITDAAIESARIRLRPILMTSLAFILGVLPLAFATGAGAAARNSVGTAVAGGMVASTILSIVFIPVLYVVIRTLVPGRPPAPAAPAATVESASHA